MPVSTRRFNLPALLSALPLLLFLLWGLFPAAFAPYSPTQMFQPFQNISYAHMLGTNDLGYDILSELIHATAPTLTVGLCAAFICLTVGCAVGILSGYLGGFWGELLNRMTEVFLLIPMLPMAIILAAFLGSGVQNVIFSISLLGWCSTARLVRAKVMGLCHTEFIHSLQLFHIPHTRILLFHILPNCREVLAARLLGAVSGCMLTEASLSFMGLGSTQVSTWGGMVNMAFQRGGFFSGALNWYLPPGLCILFCVLSFYLVYSSLKWYTNQKSNREETSWQFY